MREEDELLLDCLEDVYRAVEEPLKRVQRVRSIHVMKLEQWVDELRSQRRMFEEISLPTRLIVEHLLELQHKKGQVALETERINQPLTSVSSVNVEEFGIVKLILGELEIDWRDSNYSYYFYPDKVELRALDEKSAIKLFFSLAFGQQTFGNYPELLTLTNVSYIHPQLEKWLKEV